jgi:aminopeptidase YwaD
MELAPLEHRLREHVCALARLPRDPGSAHHRWAADYVSCVLDSHGWHVERRESCSAVGPCANIVARRYADGSRSGLLVVGAHYDTPPGIPGADDNASAVAALLELARLFSPVAPSPASSTLAIELVAFDREEDSLAGSKARVAELDSEGRRVHGMIALEMLGYTGTGRGKQASPVRLPIPLPLEADFIAVCGNLASSQLAYTVAAALREVPGQPVHTVIVPGTGLELSEVRRSDHSPFWDKGIPALMITDTSLFRNPHYHRPTDTPETLDYSFLARVTHGLGKAIGHLICRQQ